MTKPNLFSGMYTKGWTHVRQQKGGSHRKLLQTTAKVLYLECKTFDQLNESSMKKLAISTAYGKSPSPYYALEREDKGQN